VFIYEHCLPFRRDARHDEASGIRDPRIRRPRSSAPDRLPGLAAFYWHFVRQTRGLYVAMLATGLGMLR
jgi:hypothetical protein